MVHRFRHGLLRPSCAQHLRPVLRGIALLASFVACGAQTNGEQTPPGSSSGGTSSAASSETSTASSASSVPVLSADAATSGASSSSQQDASVAGSDASESAGADAASAGANDASEGGSTAPGDGGSACGSAVICDDFETYTGSTLTPWVTNTTNATLAIDGTHVYSGKQSVTFHINPGSNTAAQMTRSGAPLFPLTPNLFWGRMMVYMTELPPAAVHYDNIQADDGTGSPQYRIGGMGTILLNYQPHDCYDHIGQSYVQNKWSCWQWEYDGTANTIQFYVDGALATKVVSTSMGCTQGPATTVWQAPTFKTVHLGWINYQATTAAVDMWIDDVAMGPSQIACPVAPAGAH